MASSSSIVGAMMGRVVAGRGRRSKGSLLGNRTESWEQRVLRPKRSDGTWGACTSARQGDALIAEGWAAFGGAFGVGTGQ